jgi:adenylosuccinate lyase
MRRNLDLGRGLVFSGQLLLELTAKGMRREDAYRVIQGHATEAWKSEGDFRQRVLEDPRIRGVGEAEVARSSGGTLLTHVDALFEQFPGGER